MEILARRIKLDESHLTFKNGRLRHVFDCEALCHRLWHIKMLAKKKYAASDPSVRLVFSIIQLCFTHQHHFNCYLLLSQLNFDEPRIKCSVEANNNESIFFGEVITVKGKYEQYVRFHIKKTPATNFSRRHTHWESSFVLFSFGLSGHKQYLSSYHKSYFQFLLRIYMLVY